MNGNGTDLVLVSSLIAQREDFLGQIREAKQRGKCVVVGGPYPTSVPSDAEAAGADYLVLDEAEITLPMFLKAMADDRRPANARRQRTTIFRADGEKPDVTKTPVSRYDLLEFDAYDMMSVQFSRGCPFLCEFCDIITLYGRRPRTKTPAQFLAELDLLYDLGWRQGVFLVDDNFHWPQARRQAVAEGSAAVAERTPVPVSLRHRGVDRSGPRSRAAAPHAREQLRCSVRGDRNARYCQPRADQESAEYAASARRGHSHHHAGWTSGDGWIHRRLRWRAARSRQTHHAFRRRSRGAYRQHLAARGASPHRFVETPGVARTIARQHVRPHRDWSAQLRPDTPS